ncbi:hypothetical protein IIF46_003266 [Salmonella enterica]|nr:hypothetical protein [Salmonella enterica]
MTGDNSLCRSRGGFGRFVDSGILNYPPCCQCGGKFITHLGEPSHCYQCVMCHPPSRVIKKTAVGPRTRHRYSEALWKLSISTQGNNNTQCRYCLSCRTDKRSELK